MNIADESRTDWQITCKYDKSRNNFLSSNMRNFRYEHEGCSATGTGDGGHIHNPLHSIL